MSKLKYRSFCYTDWMNEFKTNPIPMQPKYLDMLVDEVAGGGADVLMFNPNGQTVVYPSKVWQTMWKKYESGDRTAFGTIPKEEISYLETMLKQMIVLKNDCDILEYLAASCRRKGISFGVSIRMNDVHGYEWGRNCLVSDFWYDNPQLRRQDMETVKGYNVSDFFNYAEPAVRNYYLNLVTEIVESYAIDILDLDFLRQPYCFPAGNVEVNCDIMTGFIAEVHERIHKSGKNIGMIARIPSSPYLAKHQGFDVVSWARQDLIDGLVLGNLLHSAWNIPINPFRELVGDKVALYPSADYFADTCEDLPPREIGLHGDLMRGFAAGHIASGADGIYWFNFAVTRQAREKRFFDRPASRDACRPCFEAIGESNSLVNLRGKPKTYTVFAATLHQSKLDQPSQLPVDLLPRQTREFDILLSAEPIEVKIELAVTFRTHRQTPEIYLRSFNNHILFLKQAIVPGPEDTQTALFNVPVSILRDGANKIVLCNMANETNLRIVRIEVHVKNDNKTATKISAPFGTIRNLS